MTKEVLSRRGVLGIKPHPGAATMCDASRFTGTMFKSTHADRSEQWKAAVLKLKIVFANASTMKHGASVVFASLLTCLSFMSGGAAAEPVLDVIIGGQTRHFGRDELLQRPDVAHVAVANDIAYGKAMNYVAVPLAALLAPFNPPANSVIESVAVDGFAAQLPLELVTNTDPAKAVAWLAIEPDDPHWPMLPGKAESAGPFYIVWTGAAVAKIRSEQWPYQVKRLESQRRHCNAGPRSMSIRHCPPPIPFAPVLRSTRRNACLAIP